MSGSNRQSGQVRIVLPAGLGNFAQWFPGCPLETIFSLTELPKRLGIVGAGLIGCEMAQAFARLGFEV